MPQVNEFGPEKARVQVPYGGPRRKACSARLCILCKERRALYRYQGRVRHDRYHTLCFRCYRVQGDRSRAQELASIVDLNLRLPALESESTRHDVQVVVGLPAQDFASIRETLLPPAPAANDPVTELRQCAV